MTSASNEVARASRPWQRIRRVLGVNPVALVAAAVIVIVTTMVVFASIIAPYDPLQQDLTAVLQTPSAEHLLGTDTLGRDTFSRLLYGGQPALLGMLVALLVFFAVGLVGGLLAGYFGGWVDRIINVFVDILMSLPGIIIILAILATFSQNLFAAMVTFGLLLSGSLIRVVRSSVLAIREELYVAAAQVSGLRATRIMFRHVLPGVAGPVIVQCAILAATALGVQTGLGFLGLASVPPTPTWGGMVGEAAPVMFNSPFLLFVAGGTITVMTIAFALLGDGIRDINAGLTGAPDPGAASRQQRAQRPADQAPGSAEHVLSVRDYRIAFGNVGSNEVVRGIKFEIRPGEIVGLVGESGSGKTVTGLSLLGLLPPGGAVTGGSAWLGETPLTGISRREWAAIRGRRIGLVSQEPMVALDPLFTIGSQLDEVLARFNHNGRESRRDRALELLASVGLMDAADLIRKYPHELSGGMLQRVSIAIALAQDPELIIADEPTTALDVTVQAGILDLLRSLRDSRGLTVLLITHDLAVVADVCDRVLVMREGEIVESAQVEELFAAPSHEYTKQLLASTPSLVDLNEPR